MSLKKWLVKKPDRELALELAEECSVDSFLALLALNRGIEEPYELDMFLSDEIELDDPYSLKDMDLAVDRILLSISEGEKIAVFGDYDCDGVTATALMYSYLKSRGADVIYYIPNRLTEGYGMNCESVEMLSKKGVKLIVTVDNGINASEEIDLANSLGIDVVVTDHHLQQKDLPNACAVVDPHRIDDYSDYKMLSGVGVAFKLVCALEGGASSDEMLERYSELVTLGTVGDIVPLIGENRVICRYGLKKINANPSLGISALKEVSAQDRKEMKISTLSFSLVPKINAAGRMGSSDRAVGLLLCQNQEEAIAYAQELQKENTNRQAICEEITKAACEIIDNNRLFDNNIITVYSSGWHAGIIGIVASKIVEKYGLPTIIFTEEDGVMHGSGRSVEGFNLFEAITFADAKTVTFGGHELAAGVTVELSQYDEFCLLINEYADSIPKTVSSITLDCKLRPEAITTDLVELISTLQPFGAGNPEPVFGLYNARIISVESLKSGKFVKVNIERDGYHFAVLCFSYSYAIFPFTVGNMVDIAFTPEISEFKGKKSVTLFAKQIRPNKINEEHYFESLLAFDALLRDRISVDMARDLLPSRDEFAQVFSFFRNQGRIITEEMLLYKFHTLGGGKVKVILEAFLSLSLIKTATDENSSGYVLNPVKEKVSLEDALIMIKIKESIKAGEING